MNIHWSVNGGQSENRLSWHSSWRRFINSHELSSTLHHCFKPFNAQTMAATIPRFLLPRGPSPVALRPRSVLRLPLPVRHPLPNCRHASASASKPRVLEKPTKFNPPSHGKRLKQQIPRHYGPDITQAQKSEQQTKKYPNMMPPPGSFMFWFLTSRGIHMFITLVRPSHSKS